MIFHHHLKISILFKFHLGDLGAVPEVAVWVCTGPCPLAVLSFAQTLLPKVMDCAEKVEPMHVHRNQACGSEAFTKCY